MTTSTINIGVANSSINIIAACGMPTATTNGGGNEKLDGIMKRRCSGE